MGLKEGKYDSHVVNLPKPLKAETVEICGKYRLTKYIIEAIRKQNSRELKRQAKEQTA